MSLSLESGICNGCELENSVHLNNCHNCNANLPWAGSEATKLLTEVVAPREERPSLKRLIVFYDIGTAIVTTGILFWIGNVSGLFPTFSGAGFFTVLAGGAFFKWGGTFLMSID